MYKYIKGERTVLSEVKTFLLHTFNSSYLFSHISLLILFSKCCLCLRGRGFSIYGGVLRGCEPITVSQSLCARLSICEHCGLRRRPHKSTHTHEHSKQMHHEKMWMGRIHWNVWEAHICDAFFYFHTSSKSFEI